MYKAPYCYSAANSYLIDHLGSKQGTGRWGSEAGYLLLVNPNPHRQSSHLDQSRMQVPCSLARCIRYQAVVQYSNSSLLELIMAESSNHPLASGNTLVMQDDR